MRRKIWWCLELLLSLRGVYAVAVLVRSLLNFPTSFDMHHFTVNLFITIGFLDVLVICKQGFMSNLDVTIALFNELLHKDGNQSTRLICFKVQIIT